MEPEDLTSEERAYIESMINDLEDQGVFEWVGMAEDGDRILAPNLNRMKEVVPDMYNMMIGEMEEAMFALYERGLVEIEYDENLQPGFRSSEEGKRLMQEYRFELGEHLE
mgnify:CR=1 FL=1